jgi:hypothetical protein
MAHDEKSSESGIRTHMVQAFTGLLFLLGGIVVIVESRRLGAGWTSDGPGSGYFPFLIGIVLAISSVGILYDALLSKNRNTEVFADWQQLKRVATVLFPSLVYVVGIHLLGLYVASAIFIALFMVLLGKYSWLKSILVGVLLNVVLFFMFEVWFKVPLYKGSLNPLAFLGY